MPPMCTPEKKKDIAEPPEELYVNPTDNESITDCSDIEDDAELVSERMDKLLNDLPDLGRLFNLHGQVGEGTFSTVYVASLKTDLSTKRCFAIKHIVPTCHPDRIKFELKCLKDIGGVHNVAGVDLCLRNGNNIIFVMPYQRHDSFSDYAGSMDAIETALYMKNLLIAITHVHKFNIIHRDIKPSNFLYDRFNKKFLLVDFGLAQIEPVQNHKSSGNDVYTINKQRRHLNVPLIRQRAKRPVLQNRQLNILHIHKSSEKKLNIHSQKENSSKTAQDQVPFKINNSAEQNVDNMSFIEDCNCYGKSKVCSFCLLKKNIQASRAGTPGFRPPEVLFKYRHQTTAIDIWSAGIIMLSIISNSLNFFSCPNDMAALAELVTFFGYDAMKKIAHDFGRHLVCSETKPKPDLRKVCCALRSRGNKLRCVHREKCLNCEQYREVCFCPDVSIDKAIDDNFPESAYKLLQMMLELNPSERITAEEALKHPFFNIVAT